MKHDFVFDCLVYLMMLYIMTHNKVHLHSTDFSNISEAMTPDLSDIVSANDEGSLFANYGDDSGDQRSLGKCLCTPTASNSVVQLKRPITCFQFHPALHENSGNQLLLASFILFG